MKVAFFLDNENKSSVDCSEILKGNPGIGGTEYMFIAVATLLSIRNNGICVELFTTRPGIFPKGLHYTVVDDLRAAIDDAQTNDFQYLIFKHDVNNFKNNTLENISSGLKLIPWCHVFMCYWELDYYANNPAIHRIVYVGREMRDLYRDHKAFLKSTYIYNCVNLEGAAEAVKAHSFAERKHIVTYVGSLVPFKGFHLLAEAWPEISKHVPDAELYVIGSGKLYNASSPMGTYGIAEADYENSFIQYLTKDGKILPNVHFMGKMGNEKNDILLQTKVGVPNPSGITETFCLSAVEMQMMGAKVTTINYPGYLDTVRNGVLYKKRKALAQNVITLLKDNTTEYDEAMDYFQQHFSFDIVASKWEQLLLSDSTATMGEGIKNRCYRLKWLKEGIRKINSVLPFLYGILPPVERILLFIERKRYGNVTYIDS